MYRTAFFLFFCIASTICFAQNAETLNKKSRDFLTVGDIKDAFPLLKQAADFGNAEAQYNLGYCYQQGAGVTKNDSIANFWYLKSAKQGWKDAEFKIAYSYAYGRGISQDNKQSFYWALKCATQNDPECMFDVTVCYNEGVGTGKNIDSMLVWAKRLATLENPQDLLQSSKITSARLELARMYKDGDNVAANLTESYMWYLLYNESKRDFSIGVQWAQIDTIKQLENKLTPENRVKAKANAEKLLKRSLDNFNNLYKQDD